MRRRAGYTLLEILLAVGIGLLLVAALYVALDVQMRYMQAGRQIVAEAQLARGVLNRIGTDLRSQLALLPSAASLAVMQQQMDAQTAQSSGSTSGPSTGSGGASSGGSAGAGGSAGGASSGGSDASAQAAEDPSQAAQVNFGVQGDAMTVTLFTNATPRYSLLESQNQLGYCDLRRTVYSFQGGVGLVRQETRGVLGSNLAGDAPAEVIAPEVQELRFRYFDGSAGSWVDQWDGTYLGPPMAIEVSIVLLPPLETMTGRYANRAPTTHRLVVAVPTAAVFPDPGSASGVSTPTSGGSSTSGTGGASR